jgi:hypothetical protein
VPSRLDGGTKASCIFDTRRPDRLSIRRHTQKYMWTCVHTALENVSIDAVGLSQARPARLGYFCGARPIWGWARVSVSGDDVVSVDSAACQIRSAIVGP